MLARTLRRALVAAFSLALIGGAAVALQPDVVAIEGVFERLDKALADKDEAAFKANWHSAGWEKNLVGGSGIAGRKVFSQGSRKGWFLKPDMAKLTNPGRSGPFVIPCDIWSRDKNKAVDKVWAVVAHEGKAPKILGAGEDFDEVMALARRFQDKEPLEPPAP